MANSGLAIIVARCPLLRTATRALKEGTNHPLNTAWPLFLDQDTCFQQYFAKLSKYNALSEFQFAIVKLDETGQRELGLIACARSVPFYWPELDQVGGRAGLKAQPEVLQSLPRGGYDAILTRATHQHLARKGLALSSLPSSPATIASDTESDSESDINNVQQHTQTHTWTDHLPNPPNVFSAISITVHPSYRSRDLNLAETMIQTMKRTAQQKHLDALVVPLRPTRKPEIPFHLEAALSFDPWLRKHTLLGAQVIKVARESMRVEGSMAEWEYWTGTGANKFSRMGKEMTTRQ
ncbi:uncharacterized protein ASPGLDRAFT_70243 [Aspergillus glaucus CBS 516.65]|uniref:Uncharacterized protein n=1 Tax=Aspergillus glaucus CBS 516.65 TaxID=1160497 RepID=A0A1L9V5M8_ASPGL|nr:hypothetical protein ASPGLDRAFT_70243 [Aspergillus glaucus CBS 516.65]OJJ79230.1 hypothetical protein ASPGLDRAFT_70243 [Aspergillus glaucus CBS 516.65]